MIGVAWILIVSILVALLTDKEAEETLPVIFISVILILFPFYCLNLLRIGRMLVYLLSILLLIAAAWKQRLKKFFLKVTPGIVAYIFMCAIVFLITKNNFVWLWDETRLWGAVPKALWYTEKLQLGTDAVVYPNMQSYPPAMPLLVYFIESFNRVFKESEIFFVYGVFYCALLVPALKNLKYKQFYLIPLLALVIVLLPCLITEHGGDYCYYYNSLFIDVFLGAMAGYGLYLAAARPITTRWAAYRLAAALTALVLLKDSGFLFAAGILLIAVIVNKDVPRKWLFLLVSLGMMVLANRMWGFLLSRYGVSNHVGMGSQLSTDTILQLMKKALTETVVAYHCPFFQIDLELAFAPAMFIAFAAAVFIQKKYRDVSSRANAAVILIYMATTAVFMIGYGMAFGAGLPSYQRYVSTITMAFSLFLVMRSLVILVDRIQWDWKSVFCSGMKMTLTVFAVVFLIAHAYEWEKKTDLAYICPYEGSLVHSQRIVDGLEGKQDEKQDIRLYILFSGEPARNCLLEQRIYMNLIGSGISVRNFYNDMQIVGANVSPDSPEEIYRSADAWKENLLNNYDYIYVIQTDEINNEAFRYLENESLQADSIYKIDRTDNHIKLSK